MTFEDRANKLIGKSYDAKEYHCWHLVCDLVPNAPRVNNIATTLSSLKAMNAAYSELEEIDVPANGSVVLLGNHETLVHAGVWYNGNVIHAELGGVIMQPLLKLKQRFSLVRYYNAH